MSRKISIICKNSHCYISDFFAACSKLPHQHSQQFYLHAIENRIKNACAVDKNFIHIHAVQMFNTINRI